MLCPLFDVLLLSTVILLFSLLFLLLQLTCLCATECCWAVSPQVYFVESVRHLGNWRMWHETSPCWYIVNAFPQPALLWTLLALRLYDSYTRYSVFAYVYICRRVYHWCQTVVGPPAERSTAQPGQVWIDRPLRRCVNLSRRQHLRNALFDALHQLSGTHYQKLFSIIITIIIITQDNVYSAVIMT